MDHWQNDSVQLKFNRNIYVLLILLSIQCMLPEIYVSGCNVATPACLIKGTLRYS